MKKPISFLSILALAISFASCAQKPKKQIAVHTELKDLSKYSVATFAAGCFWHEEALFESIKGVQEAVSGYAGGSTEKPTYESIEEGNTGHAETVNVYYDPAIVSFATLVKVYFAGQDPTQVNGQGADQGTQYRSVAFYRNEAEKLAIQNEIKAIQPNFKKPIAAQVMPFNKFWTAEDYHQNYIEHNPGSGYVRGVCIPEIQDFQKKYPQLIKPDHIF